MNSISSDLTHASDFRMLGPGSTDAALSRSQNVSPRKTSRMRYLSTFLMILLATPAFAALPPQAERAREIAAVAMNTDVLAMCKVRLIDAIRFVDIDLYEVQAGTCRVQAKLETTSTMASAASHTPSARRFKNQTESTHGPLGPRQFSIRLVAVSDCD